MTSTPNRRTVIELVEEAFQSGARRWRACAEVGLNVRTLRRWKNAEEPLVDGRTCAKRPPPANKLSEEERQCILKVCHDSEFQSLPPSQTVPILADRGIYIASESSFYRVLHAEGEQQHRGRAQAPRPPKESSTHCAQNPNEVWSWDITWLAGPVRGLFFYLYVILDVHSRKIVGWEVYDKELSEYAASLVRKAVMAEGCVDRPLVLHSDNGSPMKGATLRATLDRLGITPSFSRPRVSNDNPFSESAFKTCKYRPDFPVNGFETLEAARAWVHKFVRWYNEEHRHSGIGFVTPQQRHDGLDGEIMQRRREVYEEAKLRKPERWSGETRNWSVAEEVWLNPNKTDAATPQTYKQAA